MIDFERMVTLDDDYEIKSAMIVVDDPSRSTGQNKTNFRMQ